MINHNQRATANLAMIEFFASLPGQLHYGSTTLARTKLVMERIQQMGELS